MMVGGREVNTRSYVGFFFKGADRHKQVGLLSGAERDRMHLPKTSASPSPERSRGAGGGLTAPRLARLLSARAWGGVGGTDMRMAMIGLAAAMAAGAAQAATYTETGDAGQTLATAASTMTGGGAALTSISGVLDTNDADLFRIYISDPSSFSATTLNGGTDDGALDTEIFLFDAQGHAVAADDDDQGGLSTDSTLPVGDGHYAGLAAGEYILGISISGNDPVNLNNQLLFETNADTTQVRGAAGGLNPTTLAGFDGFQYYTNDPGAYRIDLTGVSTGPMSAAPEPGTWALMVAGVALAGAALRRRTGAAIAA